MSRKKPKLFTSVVLTWGARLVPGGDATNCRGNLHSADAAETKTITTTPPATTSLPPRLNPTSYADIMTYRQGSHVLTV